MFFSTGGWGTYSGVISTVKFDFGPLIGHSCRSGPQQSDLLRGGHQGLEALFFTNGGGGGVVGPLSLKRVSRKLCFVFCYRSWTLPRFWLPPLDPRSSQFRIVFLQLPYHSCFFEQNGECNADNTTLLVGMPPAIATDRMMLLSSVFWRWSNKCRTVVKEGQW